MPSAPLLSSEKIRGPLISDWLNGRVKVLESWDLRKEIKIAVLSERLFVIASFQTTHYDPSWFSRLKFNVQPAL